MKIFELLNAVINSSEKGANIARIIRSESSLLDLLVQEKKGTQKNERFVQDFKTLSDVLVQETVRYDLSQQFPGIGDSIQGEENNKFTNILGESVAVSVQSTVEKTQALLATVLDENDDAAKILAGVVHNSVNVCDHTETNLLDQPLDQSQLGVWIDPIDSTAQYIQGQVGEVVKNGQVSEGLQCVTVLIGVFDKSTGLPILGVVNQPFFKQDTETESWIGRHVWGVSVGSINSSSLTQELPAAPPIRPLILASNSESPAFLDALSNDFEVMFISGAGYKLLGVALGKADAYVLTRNSNFKWDCCGPHAILRSCGGSIVSCVNSIQAFRNSAAGMDYKTQIRYHHPDVPGLDGANIWSNNGGIIAYRNEKVLDRIVKALIEASVSFE